MDAQELAKAHLESYGKAQRACLQKLLTIFSDLELAHEKQKGEVTDVCLRAQDVWSSAVEEAETRRSDMRNNVEAALREVDAIKMALGDSSQVELPSASEEIIGSSRKTLRAIFEEVQGNLEHWREQKTARMAEYEAVMTVHLALKAQLGIAHVASKVDISTLNMEFLRMENEKLQAERGRRQAKLEEQVSKLQEICSELGEDDRAAAGDVHPSLRNLSRDKASADVLATMYKLAGAAAGCSSDSSLLPDLSSATFGRMEAKVGELHALKAERAAQVQNVLEVLSSLWNALEIAADAPERATFGRIMSGPHRLHARSLEKCMAEVSRLEECKVQAIHDLISAKARELQEVCAATHITPPDVSSLLAEAARRKEESALPGAAAGQVADLLSKLVRMVCEVGAVASRRAPVLALIAELQEAREESEWLREYDNDADRYKGRDANRKLQRAIKSGKMRERMPALIASLRSALSEWEAAEGGPFVYDDRVQREALEEVTRELADINDEKARATSSKGVGGIGRAPGVAGGGAAGAGSGARHAQAGGMNSTMPARSSAGGAAAAAGGSSGVRAGAGAGAGAMLPGGSRPVSAAPGAGAAGGEPRPLMTPRGMGVGDAGRRASMATAPMQSARDGGTWGRSSSRPSSAVAQSHQDFSAIIKPSATPNSAISKGGNVGGVGSATKTATTNTATKDPIHTKFMRIMASSPMSQQFRPTPAPAASPAPSQQQQHHHHDAPAATPQSRLQPLTLDQGFGSTTPVAVVAAAAGPASPDDGDDVRSQRDLTPKAHAAMQAKGAGVVGGKHAAVGDVKAVADASSAVKRPVVASGIPKGIPRAQPNA